MRATRSKTDASKTNTETIEKLPSTYSRVESETMKKDFRDRFLETYKNFRAQFKLLADVKRKLKNDVSTPGKKRSKFNALKRQRKEVQETISQLDSSLNDFIETSLTDQLKVKWLFDLPESLILPVQTLSFVRKKYYVNRNGSLKRFELRDMSHALPKADRVRMIQIDSDIIAFVSSISKPFEDYRSALDHFIPEPDSQLADFEMAVTKFRTFDDADMAALRREATKNPTIQALLEEARACIEACESPDSSPPSQEALYRRNTVLLDLFLRASGIKRDKRKTPRARRPAVYAYGLSIIFPFIPGGPQMENMKKAIVKELIFSKVLPPCPLSRLHCRHFHPPTFIHSLRIAAAGP